MSQTNVSLLHKQVNLHWDTVWRNFYRTCHSHHVPYLLNTAHTIHQFKHGCWEKTVHCSLWDIVVTTKQLWKTDRCSKRWLEGLSQTRNLSGWPLTCQRCTILLWWILWFLQIEVLLMATEWCMIHNALFIPVCHRRTMQWKKGLWSVWDTAESISI